jgi:hypothetical protein
MPASAIAVPALTPRDIAVLLSVGERGCVTPAQLHAQFWAGAALSTCRDRLRVLVRAGLLGRAMTTCRGPVEEIVWLEPSGRRHCPTARHGDLVCGRPTLVEQAHLLRTADVLARLERTARVIAWSSERTLKGARLRAHSDLPAADLALTLDRDGLLEHWLVEIDGAYYGAALDQKIAGLGRCERDVLWIVFSTRRLAAVLARCRAHPTIRPVLFDAR